MIKYSINDSLKFIVRDLEKVAEKKMYVFLPPPVFASNPIAFKGILDELVETILLCFRGWHAVQHRAEYCTRRKRIPILLKPSALLIVLSYQMVHSG